MLEILLNLAKKYPLLKSVNYTNTHLIMEYKNGDIKKILIDNDFDTLIENNYVTVV